VNLPNIRISAPLSFCRIIRGQHLLTSLKEITLQVLSARMRGRRSRGVTPALALLFFVIALPVINNAQTRPPVLVSDPVSTRAIAFESPTFFREPFTLTSPFGWSTDTRTRVMLFALNLSLQPGEDLSVMTADAEDAAHRHYNLRVEYVGPVPQQSWLSAVIIRLSDDLTAVGDVLVSVSYHGVASNRVRLGIGQISGGPPDDIGATPTPAPPYVISGQVLSGGVALGGVSVVLSGPQTQMLTTDESGFYSFTVNTVDDYVLSASKPYFNFSPPSRAFFNLSNQQPHTDFIATRQLYTVGGEVRDDNGQGLGGVEVRLTDGATGTFRVATTNSGGNFTFAEVTAGQSYTVTATDTSYFAFASQTTGTLTGNLTLTLNGVRRTYTIHGRVADSTSQDISGVTVNLSGSQTAATTTDFNGDYSFANIAAGGNYTLTPVQTALYNFSSRSVNNLDEDRTISLDATLRQYTISGRLADAQSMGINAATITLGGSQTGSVQTDAGGNFALTVFAGGSYTITPSKLYYNFSPATLTLEHLTSNQEGFFGGTLRRHIISGQVRDDNGQGLAGVEVRLYDEAHQLLSTTIAGAGGNFTFPEAAAGQSYTVTAVDTSFFAFASQTTGTLVGNLTLTLNGVRRTYTIHGQIVDAPDHGLGGVVINLGGAQAMTTTTDASGNYSFAGLAAGSTYAVTPSKTDYTFSPANQTFPNLAADQESDFTGALPVFNISGRVTDASGNGLVGIAINLTGFQTRTARTGSDGQYSLDTAGTGDYIVTPAIEQDSYLFTPASRSLQNLRANQTLNFTATATPVPSPSYVLEYDGTQKTVDYGNYWEPYVDLGHFYWEFWAMPGNNAGGTYMISDGYGGDHALLFGFSNYNEEEPGRYQLFGDIFDGYVSGGHIIFFASDQGPAIGEWGHFAVGWDGQSIITYFDGVPVGKVAYAGTRATPSPGYGGNRLLIGGSDHNNLVGRIAQVRGYEGRNPLEEPDGPTGGAVEAAFAPQTVFGVGGNLLSYFFRPAAPKVADLSRGFDGITHEGSTHTGTPRGTTFGVLSDCGNCPPPKFVIDPTAPNFAQGIAPQPVLVPVAPPVPDEARVFDSFSRPNSTYLFGAKGGLGSIEGGAAGAQVWQTGVDASMPQPFGLLNGRAVLLANGPAMAWIPKAASNGSQDVRVDRHPGNWGSGLDTGLSFRVVDAGNFFFAYTGQSSSNSSTPRKLTVGYYQNGQRSELGAGLSLPTFWTTLRVVSMRDGQIKVYADATLVYSTTSNLLSGGMGAGLYNNAAGLGLVNRWDNFTVYDVP
jgi:hypothetical protein